MDWPSHSPRRIIAEKTRWCLAPFVVWLKRLTKHGRAARMTICRLHELTIVTS
jgi:hypothetical protein